MGVIPTGTVTFLFTDIEGHTRLWDLYPEATATALATHDDMLATVIAANRGYVFTTSGDSFSAAFQSTGDAVAAAVSAQRALDALDWPEGVTIRVRMGLHSGEARVERDGDYFGPAVIRAARIMSVAHGGQILVSQATAALLGEEASVLAVPVATLELRGLSGSETVHQLVVDGLQREFPALRTLQLGRGNLPRLQTEWVGDLANLQRRVANLAQASVVTLTGSGGVGKTRAAIEIGWLVGDEFVDGVWLVELAPIADPHLVATAIAGTLGVSLQPGWTMIESIVDWCLGRRMLLIIDNCEHVLEPVIELVGGIVAGCATVTVIATSREPLGVAGEMVARIASLEERDAVELFVLRARSADAGFEPSEGDRDAIAGICRRVDGIPLAIELAAARIRSLSPAELLERLDDRFRLLRGGGRGGLERHQTLRATVAWSYQLLTGDAQLLFDRLSVFAGSFDLAATETICAGDDLDPYDIVDLLGDLVDKSMVSAVRNGRTTRYRLLETLRQYGEERLDERRETTIVRDAHLRHFVAVSRRLGERWDSPDQADAGDRFDDDWENLGAAHAWAITTGDIAHAHALIGATGGFAIERVRRDHQEWGARTLELADSAERHDAMTLVWQGHWAFFDGDLDRAVALGELATAVDAPGPAVLARALSLFGHSAAGRTDSVTEIATELRHVLPTVTDSVERYWAALAIQLAYDPATSDVDTDTVVAAARAVGAPFFVANALRNAAGRLLFTDPPDSGRAIVDFDEAIRLHESVGTSPHWEWMLLTWTRTIADDPAALNTLQQAVLLTYDQRNWSSLDATLEAAPALLTRHAPVVAATIHGYLESSSPPYGQIGIGLRAMATEFVTAIPDNEIHRARGAAMDRHEIAALTLAALDDN